MLPQEYIIKENISVREAMRKLDACEKKIVFVVTQGKLCATLTDGDIRRYLMNGGSLESMAIEAANRNPKFAKNLQQARTLYHEKNYIAIPVVDDSGQLRDVYLGDWVEQEHQYDLNIPVVINAGGKGTRLDPYTRVLPKPLIPIGEMPIIEHIMQAFIKYGCNEFHIIVNYKKQLMKSYFNEAETSYNITWYDEETPLGTGGGLSLLKGKMKSTFVFANCDTLMLSNYESMLRFHREHSNTVTMIGAYKSIDIPYGVVEMGRDGVIEGMREKPEMSMLANTGMYIVEPEVLEDIVDGVAVGFPDIIKKQQAAGRRVAVYPVSENEWLDMGQLPELEKMRIRLYGE